MSDSTMCPLCGGKLTDIRADGEPYAPGEAKAGGAAGWGCWGDGTARRTAGCGARGRYGRSWWRGEDRRGGPIANRPDSARLGEMCDRLLDAPAATSDRGRVERLVGCVSSLRMENLDILPGRGRRRAVLGHGPQAIRGGHGDRRGCPGMHMRVTPSA